MENSKQSEALSLEQLKQIMDKPCRLDNQEYPTNIFRKIDYTMS